VTAAGFLAARVTSTMGGGAAAEVVPRFVDLEVAVPRLSPAVW
jgi:hypothetical protein